MFSFLKRLTRKRSRDLDYRGVSTSVNWLKLGYMARTRKPGALEILQDAIETYFPKQFKTAQNKAKKKFKGLPPESDVFVLFNYRQAHGRFKPKGRTRRIKTKTGKIKIIPVKWKRRSLPKSVSPFWVGLGDTHTGGMNTQDLGRSFLSAQMSPPLHLEGDVIVWSVRRGKNLGNIR